MRNLAELVGLTQEIGHSRDHGRVDRAGGSAPCQRHMLGNLIDSESGQQHGAAPAASLVPGHAKQPSVQASSAIPGLRTR